MLQVSARLRVGCHLHVHPLRCRRVRSLQRNIVHRLQPWLVFSCRLLFLHELHDGQLQPSARRFMQVVPSGNLVICYRSLVIGIVPRMSPGHMVSGLGCNVNRRLQSMPLRNFFEFDRRFRCQSVLSLPRRVLLRLSWANVSQQLRAVSRRHIFVSRCSSVLASMRRLPRRHILCSCKHSLHPLPPEFLFIEKCHSVHPLPRKKLLICWILVLLRLPLWSRFQCACSCQCVRDRLPAFDVLVSVALHRQYARNVQLELVLRSARC